MKIINELVVNPIEIMIEKVHRISENPLKAAAEEENAQIALLEQELAEGKSHKKV